MTRKHRHEEAYPRLWKIVDGAIKQATDAHPEFQIATRASLTKRVVGALLAPEARTAIAVEMDSALLLRDCQHQEPLLAQRGGELLSVPLDTPSANGPSSIGGSHDA